LYLALRDYEVLYILTTMRVGGTVYSLFFCAAALLCFNDGSNSNVCQAVTIQEHSGSVLVDRDGNVDELKAGDDLDDLLQQLHGSSGDIKNEDQNDEELFSHHQFLPNNFLRETSCQQYNNTTSLSCNKYQIQTLTSNPRRCLHITSNNKSNNREKDVIPCLDHPNWFDGTNGCSAYAKHKDTWCEAYGNISRMSSEHKTANEACCACGGGMKNYKRRFNVGDLVSFVNDVLNNDDDDYGYGNNANDDCEFEIVSYGGAPSRHGESPLYTLQPLEDCGPTTYTRERKGKYLTNVPSRLYKKGNDVFVSDDDSLRETVRVELKKCRVGVAEQEFWAIPVASNDDEDGGSNENNDDRQSFILQHVISNVTLGPQMTPSTEERNQAQNIIQLRRVFVEEEKQFYQSDEYVYIESVPSPDESSSSYSNQVMLVSGHFTKTEISKPEWPTSSDTHLQLPTGMWTLLEVNSTEINEGGSRVDPHAKWLENKITASACTSGGIGKNGENDNLCDGLEYLKQLPPWTLLDVERNAPKADVKARFRQLSKHFHPDKKRGPLFEQVFVLLQAAYEGLKNSDDTEKEAFRLNAEVESQLFPHSQFVIELLPSHWTLIGNETRDERYVISMPAPPSALDEGNETMGELSAQNQTEEVQLWLLFLYSPRCSMSRSMVSFLELAAEHLQGENIKTGAYGCGIYGESLEESKQKGFEAWMSDPICKQFGRRETPNTHFVVESVNGYTREDGNITSFGRRVSKFRTFHAPAATGTAHDQWPAKYIHFAMNSKRDWEDSEHVKYVERKDFDDPMFNSTDRILAFIDDTEVEDVQEAILSVLPNIARRLTDAEIIVGVISCASELEDDPRLVDCSTLDVSWLPDIKLFAANATTGISLLSEEFSERRDVQIAIEAMANTLTAFFGLQEGSIMDDQSDEQGSPDDGPQSEGSCMQFGDSYDVDDSLEKLDAPDEMDQLEAPEEEMDQIDMEKEQDVNDVPPELGEGNRDKPKLADASSGKPKLAQRSNKNVGSLPQFAKRKIAHRGGGNVLGGRSGGGSSVGAIAG